MEGIRIGTVSAIDKKNGMVSVTYPDREDTTTDFLPYLTFASEYKMPEQEDMVLVVYLSNGVTDAVVVGGFWNKGNVPDVAAGTGWKKFIAENSDMEYDKDSHTLKIHAPRVVFSCDDGSLCLNDWLKGGA